MKPVAIFRYAAGEGPGYFSTFLERHGIPQRLLRIDQGDEIPDAVDGFCALGLMGGAMSVNDPLPWIGQLVALIKQAVARGVPVIGHCLGGQLLSRSLGGVVSRNPVKEIGWGTVTLEDVPAAREWFGQRERFEAFHWHGETFTIPPGATRLAASAHCANQAFVYGPHLGLQCHVEMTAPMVQAWCQSGVDEIAAADSPAVQSSESIQRDLPMRLSDLHTVADRLYARWLQGVALSARD